MCLEFETNNKNDSIELDTLEINVKIERIHLKIPKYYHDVLMMVISEFEHIRKDKRECCINEVHILRVSAYNQLNCDFCSFCLVRMDVAVNNIG